MNQDDIHAFFARYREAFNRLDGDAVADLWHDASGIAHDGLQGGQLTWWAEDAPMRDNHRALCALYRSKGYDRAEFEIVDLVPMGRHHAFAHLLWTLSRADGSVLQRFHTGYQLLRTDHGIRVVLATAYQEDLTEMKRHAAQ